MIDIETETALIFTVGSIVGSIVVTQMWQLNWFKRENFKISRDVTKAENKLKLKKLEKELGITSKARGSAPAAPSASG